MSNCCKYEGNEDTLRYDGVILLNGKQTQLLGHFRHCMEEIDYQYANCFVFPISIKPKTQLNELILMIQI